MRFEPTVIRHMFTAVLISVLGIELLSANTFAARNPQIAFTTTRHGHDEIYVMDADGTNVERLTHDLAPKGYPSWSPDGQKIAFSGKIDGNMEIFVVSPDGKRLKRLTENEVYDDYPSWSPDSQLIAFVSHRNVGFREPNPPDDCRWRIPQAT